jgi:GDP-L-fucose synthase
MENNMRILVTGGAGFLGRYVVEKLLYVGYKSILALRSSQTDLRSINHVEKLLRTFHPDIVIHLAATVGGIGANMANPGTFFYDNMMMGLNLIECSRVAGVRKFIHVGTVCSYPKDCPTPFKESDLWNGYPEETNAPYGIAKKSLFVMLDAYYKEYGFNSSILMPSNLYGPGDNFKPESSHVIPAIIKKMVEAKDSGASSVTCWGSGSATRDFLYVENAADAIVKSLSIDTKPQPINLGSGSEISIKDLTNLIASKVGFNGEILWDSSKPDGQPRRLLDTSLAQQILGWNPTTGLDEGLTRTVEWYASNRE